MQDVQKEKYRKELGLLIKKIRLKQNKSISLICAEIGMTKSMWADLEKGIKDPQLSTLMRMSEALNTKTSLILNKLENKLGQEFSFIE
ncbi:helix-turn-helix transcriptional regulator [bacterium]|nr:helix-turn-helix transcriptional regulator [bacterium]